MSRTTTLLLLAMTMISTALAQIPWPTFKFSDGCTQSFTQLAASGNIEQFIPVLVNQMGNPGMCEQNGNRFCPLVLAVVCSLNNTLFEIPNAMSVSCNFMPSYGACMNPNTTQCSSDIMNLQLESYCFFNPNFQPAYGLQSACVDTSKIPPACLSSSFATLRAQCLDELPKLADDTNALIVLYVIVAMVAICLICSFIAFVDRSQMWWAEETRSQHDEDDDNHNNRKSVPTSHATLELSPLLNRLISDTNPVPADALAKRWIPPALLAYAKWFDIISNIGNFFEVRSRNHGDIDTSYFEGVRMISMLFVIYGHTGFFPFVLTGYTNNIAVVKFLTSYASIVFYPAELAVDNFFFLSGFLFMHLYMKQIEKKGLARRKSILALKSANADSITASADDLEKQEESEEAPDEPLTIIETLVMYARRYLRMTPVVMISLFASEYLLKYIPNGAMNEVYRDSSVFTDCAANWWRQMLYITKDEDAEKGTNCMGWFWYLSCDFQLFLVGGVLGWVYFKKFYVWCFLMFGMMATVVALAGHNEPFGGGRTYYRVYTRAAPYFYGMIGAVLVRYKPLVRQLRSVRVRMAVYFISSALLFSTINIMWLNEKHFIEDKPPGDFFRFLSFWTPIAWGLGWLMLSVTWSTRGAGGMLTRALGHPALVVLSKLTFCCYMLHPVIMIVNVANQPGMMTFSVQVFYMQVAGYVVWTFIAALVLHVIVELPFAQMNNLLTRRVDKKKPTGQ